MTLTTFTLHFDGRRILLGSLNLKITAGCLKHGMQPRHRSSSKGKRAVHMGLESKRRDLHHSVVIPPMTVSFGNACNPPLATRPEIRWRSSVLASPLVSFGGGGKLAIALKSGDLGSVTSADGIMPANTKHPNVCRSPNVDSTFSYFVFILNACSDSSFPIAILNDKPNH
jgi:hypothetical protein